MDIEQIRQKAEEYLPSETELLKQLIAIPSVKGEPEEGAPFGRECRRVLEFAEKTLKDDGFVVKNVDNYVVTAQMDEREPELGILAHLDVVPVAGQSWTADPFTADVRDGRIYGRGSIDDKGPAAAIITCMRIIRDMKIPLKRNFRLIMGSDEENGSSDLEYYLKREKFPPMLFTPDADWPLVVGEKGNIRYEISGEYAPCDIVSLTGGSVINAVPERAQAVLTHDIEIEHHYDGVTFTKEQLPDGNYQITAVGRGAHASTPQNGVNALTALLAVLSGNVEDSLLGGVIGAVSMHFPFGEWDGESAGIKTSDKLSGALTAVLSVADCHDGRYRFFMDSRFPVTARGEDTVKLLDDDFALIGGRCILCMEPHLVDENSEFVQQLLAAYEDMTGEKGFCRYIGGGTYVHETANGVAFGAEWTTENNMHGADEFIGIDELRRDTEIYLAAILRLCC